MIKVGDASFVMWRGFTRYSGLFETKNTPHVVGHLDFDFQRGI